MRVLYQRYGVQDVIAYNVPPSQLERLETSGFPPALLSRDVLLYDPVLETAPASSTALAARYREVHPNHVETAGLIVIRGAGARFVKAVRQETLFLQDVRPLGK